MSQDTMTSKVSKPYAGAEHISRLLVFDSNHQRYTQRFPDARLEAEFTTNAASGWMSVHLTEQTEDKNGKVSTRTIAATLDKEHVDKLRKILNHEEVTNAE